MHTEQELRKKIMRRVYGIYIVRQLTSPLMRFAVLATVFFAIASSVSLPHVFQNALTVSSIPGFVTFWTVALVSTTVAVKVFTLVAFAVVAWTLWDVVSRSTSRTHAVA